MKKVVLLCVLLGAFAAGSASASPTDCYCYGGMDGMGGYWYLYDYSGYPLADGDWVYVAWTGPDGDIDLPSTTGHIGAPAYDDVLLMEGEIEWAVFYIKVTTWAPEDGNHPWTGETIYCRIWDGPPGSITTANWYGTSDLHTVENYPGEEFFCLFPGDPGYGYTGEWLWPVELMTFAALGRDGQVLLEWKTATETDNFGFHMERSLDALTFQRITEEIIPGAGNSETENTYAYVDRGLINGTTYYYNLISVDMDGVEEVANEDPVAATPMAHVPTAFALYQNYPNPFNPDTEIKYAIPSDVSVTLKVYNVLGAEVATLVNASQKAGIYSARWDARDLASGVYFCRLQAGEFGKTVKMVLLR